MKAPPRLLFVLPATAIGGAERRFAHIMEKLEGYSISLITHRCIRDLFDAERIDLEFFDDAGLHAPMPMGPSQLFSYGKAIRNVLEKRPAALVFGIMHVGTLYASFARDLMWGAKPTLMGSILGNVSGYFDRFGRKPTIWEEIVIRYMIQRPERVVVSSQGVKKDLIQRFKGSAQRIEVIPNGIDLEAIRTYRRVQAPGIASDPAFRIVTTCRLNAQKDVATLIRAVSRLLENGLSIQLDIIGGGEERETLEALTRTLKISEKIHFHGALASPYEKMAEADLFVLSSFFEGFGNVILEAMALHLPVIATDCPSGPSEIIRDRKTGILVPIEHPEALAGAIRELFEAKSLRENLANAADLELDQFDARIMMGRYQALIEEGVQSSPRSSA